QTSTTLAGLLHHHLRLDLGKIIAHPKPFSLSLSLPEGSRQEETKYLMISLCCEAKVRFK
ncbi:MAG: hypothetical protein AAFY30_10805, partial [Cyanobacteria bacterium J06642_12]